MTDTCHDGTACTDALACHVQGCIRGLRPAPRKQGIKPGFEDGVTFCLKWLSENIDQTTPERLRKAVDRHLYETKS